MAGLRRRLRSIRVHAASWLRMLRIPREIECVSGPAAVDLDPHDVVVVCVVRNGAPYIDSFLDHYTTLGVRHIVFLDNGSTDDTVALAAAHEWVTVLRSRLPYGRYKYEFKKYLIRRFARRRWSLCVDIDELFDYPLSSRAGLDRLVEYLSGRGYTAVAAQMLDMFSDRRLASTVMPAETSLRREYRYYDLSNVEALDYAGWGPKNLVSNPAIRFCIGGVRRSAFGANNWLTKHPLLFCDGRVRFYRNSAHSVRGARIADLSCVLYHYKFLPDFVERAEDAVARGCYKKGSMEYRKYLRALKTKKDLTLMTPAARELHSVDELVAQGFLVVSDDYTRFMTGPAPRP